MNLKEILRHSGSLPLTKSLWSLQHGIEHLTKVDHRFIPLFEEHGIPSHYVHPNTPESITTTPFQVLLKTITYQQLSEKAAKPIYERLLNIWGVNPNDKEHKLEPYHILQSHFDTIYIDDKKKITINGIVSGLSASKASYIQDLARHFSDDTLLKSIDLSVLSDEELYNKLLAVKGLGPWSVHIFMMFQLQRQDVLPIGDLGVRRAICSFFNHPLNYFEDKKKHKELLEVCACWSPYSSLASSMMWNVSNKLMNKETKLIKTPPSSSSSSLSLVSSSPPSSSSSSIKRVKSTLTSESMTSPFPKDTVTLMMITPSLTTPQVQIGSSRRGRKSTISSLQLESPPPSSSSSSSSSEPKQRPHLTSSTTENEMTQISKKKTRKS